MQNWFRQLKRREQWLLLLGAGCVLAYVLVMAIWRPLLQSEASLRQRNVVLEQSLQTVRQLAAEYRALLQTGARDNPASGQSLAQLIDSTAGREQLSITRFQPGANGDAQLRLDNVAFNQLLAWLYQLETAHAVIIQDLAINPANAEGLVNVTLRVRQGV